MNIANLLTLQDGVRSTDLIRSMADFASNGGYWTADYLHTLHPGKIDMIKLVRFEDGKMGVNDGHHRLLATWISGREILRPDEYIVQEWTYASYSEINFDFNWITPFDPRKETRLSDFGDFKKKVMSIAAIDKTEAIDYILSHKHCFATKRRLWYIPEMQESVWSSEWFVNHPVVLGRTEMKVKTLAETIEYLKNWDHINLTDEEVEEIYDEIKPCLDEINEDPNQPNGEDAEFVDWYREEKHEGNMETVIVGCAMAGAEDYDF